MIIHPCSPLCTVVTSLDWMYSMPTIGPVVAPWQGEESPLAGRSSSLFRNLLQSWRSFPPSHIHLTGCTTCSRWDLGEPTHTLVPCWMSKPLPSRNRCTGWFAPTLTLGRVVAPWQHQVSPLARSSSLFWNLLRWWRSFPPPHIHLTGCIECSYKGHLLLLGNIISPSR